MKTVITTFFDSSSFIVTLLAITVLLMYKKGVFDKFKSKLTERRLGLARLIEFGGFFAWSDLVDGIHSE